MNKEERRILIKMIVQENHITSKRDILSIIRDKFNEYMSLSTITNDLKALHITKVPLDSSTYVFQVPENTPTTDHSAIIHTLYQYDIQKIVISNHCLMIHTSPGFAQKLNYHIDALELPEILGSVSGNDFTLLMTSSNQCAQQLQLKLFDPHHNL